MGQSPQEIIDRVVAFEKDLAAFYADSPLRARSAALEKICRFMAKHSEIHAQMIANYREDAKIPGLAIDPLTTLHERLKTNLRLELTSNGDAAHVAGQLAQAEAIIGQAYAKIADHFDAVADTYRRLAGKFRALSDDERQHRDYIRREIQREGPPAGAVPTKEPP